MTLRPHHPQLIIPAIISLFLAFSAASYAQTATYIYDELNRLKRVEYDNGTAVEYTYDGAGNRLQVRWPDITPPTTTATPLGGIYNTSRVVTLTCDDGSGSGCDKIYYTTNGITPTASSAVYATSLSITSTTTLKYFAKDVAGNNEAVKTQTYTVDSMVPTGSISINSGSQYTTSTNVSLTLSCNDANGCAQMQFSNDNLTYSAVETYNNSKSWALAVGDGNKTVYVKFKDSAGNWSAAYNSTIKLDTTLPTGAISVNSGAASTNNANVTLTLTCTDANNCAQIQFSNDNATYSTPETYAGTKSWVLSAGDGTKTVYVKFKDVPGNWSSPYSSTITLDSTPPTTTASPAEGLYNSAQSVTLTCNDGTGLGCTAIRYTVNGTTPTMSSPIYSAPISVAATKTVKFFAVDNIGNSEAVQSQNYTIDATKPTGTIKINSGDTLTNSPDVTLTLTCSDANGCAQMQFSNDNVTYSTPEAFNATKIWTVTTGDGSKTIRVKFQDMAGNWSVVYSDTIKLDTTLPTGTITINAGDTSTNSTDVTLRLTCSDTNTCSQMQFSNDNVTYSEPQTYAATKAWSVTAGDGNKTVYGKFMDKAGNWSTVYNSGILLDTTSPATSATPTGGVYGAPISVVLSCADGSGSGCDKIYYTTNGNTPSTLSAHYTAPISISTTKTLKFFAKDLAGNSQPVQTENYTINICVPQPGIDCPTDNP